MIKKFSITEFKNRIFPATYEPFVKPLNEPLTIRSIKEKKMNSVIKIAFLGIGAALIWLWDKEPKVVAVIASAKKEDKPTEEEVRKVMRELGKKSGVSRRRQ